MLSDPTPRAPPTPPHAAAAAAVPDLTPSPSVHACAQLRRDRARELLARGWQPHMSTPAYDPEHALVLCRLRGFSPGLLFLFDKMRMPRELLQVSVGEVAVGASLGGRGG